MFSLNEETKEDTIFLIVIILLFTFITFVFTCGVCIGYYEAKNEIRRESSMTIKDS